jgi:hypothetical protein
VMTRTTTTLMLKLPILILLNSVLPFIMVMTPSPTLVLSKSGQPSDVQILPRPPLPLDAMHAVMALSS